MAIGFKKRKKSIIEKKWVECPDKEHRKRSILRRLIGEGKYEYRCIHQEQCENYKPLEDRFFTCCIGGEYVYIKK